MSTLGHTDRKRRISPRQPQRQHVSVRLGADTLEGLDRRAELTGEPRTALVERYISEGLQMDEHPLIYFRSGAAGRRPALVGTRLDVWKVIETLRNHDNSVEDTAEYLSLPISKVRAAISYYAVHEDEVDTFARRALEEAERAEAAWRREQQVLARN
jgi:uncharacterized protein (DUF433 family)